MKKTILIALVLLLVNTLNAQGNLQFNQVKHLTYTGSFNPSKGGSIIVASLTVPENKVWKIESGSVFRDWATRLSTSYCYFLLDKQFIQNQEQQPTLPIWLGTGKYDLVFYYSIGVSLDTESNYTAAISVLEFNIIP